MDPDQREHMNGLDEALAPLLMSDTRVCEACGCIFVVIVDGDLTWVDRFVSPDDVGHQCPCHLLRHHLGRVATR